MIKLGETWVKQQVFSIPLMLANLSNVNANKIVSYYIF